jgi:photosystem II stability/assembly factor-like uncharacterized protein
MKPAVLSILLLFSLAVVSVQAQWVDEGGPYGGAFAEIVRHSGGYYAVPWYRPFLLSGNEDGSSWKLLRMPDVSATIFRVLRMEDRIITGGFGRVWLSDDEGVSWRERRIDVEDAAALTSLVEHRGDMYSANAARMHVSSDHGENWKRLPDAPAARSLLSLGDVLLATGQDGCSRSTDGGESWEILNGFPHRGNRIVANQTGTVLLIAEASSGVFASSPVLFRSLDSGRTWSACSFPGDEIEDAVHASGVWYAATRSQGVFRSFDDGLTWESHTTVTPYARRITALQAASSGVLAAVDGIGIWRADSTAVSWSFVSDGTLPVGVAQLDIRDDNTFALSLRDNQLYVRAAGQSNWEMRHYPIAEKPTSMLLYQGRLLLAAVGAVYSSVDDGATWNRSEAGLASDRQYQALAAYSEGLIMGVRRGGVVISTDAGESWTVRSDFNAEDWYHIIEHNAVLYAATTQGLAVSEDGGATWNTLLHSSGWKQMYRLSASGSTILCAGEAGLYDYDIGNKSWSQVYDGPVYAVARSRGGVFAITRDHGVIRFTPSLDRYTTYSEGLPETGFVPPSVCRAELIERGGRLYLGSCGLPGLFSLDAGAVSRFEAAYTQPVFSLQALYPSPMRAAAALHWTIATPGTVRIEIVDALGRRVRTIVDGFHAAGSYTHAVDMTGLRAGCYMIRMVSGSAQALRRFMRL